jgi:hypothetical protein
VIIVPIRIRMIQTLALKTGQLHLPFQTQGCSGQEGKGIKAKLRIF